MKSKTYEAGAVMALAAIQLKQVIICWGPVFVEYPAVGGQGVPWCVYFVCNSDYAGGMPG